MVSKIAFVAVGLLMSIQCVDATPLLLPAVLEGQDGNLQTTLTWTIPASAVSSLHIIRYDASGGSVTYDVPVNALSFVDTHDASLYAYVLVYVSGGVDSPPSNPVPSGSYPHCSPIATVDLLFPFVHIRKQCVCPVPIGQPGSDLICDNL
jgi:hypothetical protein